MLLLKLGELIGRGPMTVKVIPPTLAIGQLVRSRS